MVGAFLFMKAGNVTEQEERREKKSAADIGANQRIVPCITPFLRFYPLTSYVFRQNMVRFAQSAKGAALYQPRANERSECRPRNIVTEVEG